MRKLLFLSPVSNLSNGATRGLLGAMRQAKVKGYEVIVICPDNGELIIKAQLEGFKTFIVKFDWWMRPKDGSNIPYDQLQQINGEAVLELVKIIINEEPFACITYTATAPWLAYAAAIMKTPHIWEICEFVTEPSTTFTYRLGLKDTLSTINLLSDKVFAMSKSVRSQLIKDLPDFSDIGVLYPLTETWPKTAAVNTFPKKDAFKIVLTGNIQDSKGQLDAVNATINLLNKNLNVQLAMVGGTESDKPYVNKIRKVIDSNGQQNNIFMTGFKSNPYPYIKSADVVLVCSTSEAFGLVTTESMALGKPVVGADSGGTREILQKDGLYGFLYTPGDVEELSNKIEAMIEDRGLTKRLGEKARLYANKKFTSSEKIHKPLFDYLESIAKEYSARKFYLTPLEDMIEDLNALHEKLYQTEKLLNNTTTHVKKVENSLLKTQSEYQSIVSSPEYTVIRNSRFWSVLLRLRARLGSRS